MPSICIYKVREEQAELSDDQKYSDYYKKLKFINIQVVQDNIFLEIPRAQYDAEKDRLKQQFETVWEAEPLKGLKFWTQFLSHLRHRDEFGAVLSSCEVRSLLGVGHQLSKVLSAFQGL